MTIDNIVAGWDFKYTSSGADIPEEIGSGDTLFWDNRGGSDYASATGAVNSSVVHIGADTTGTWGQHFETSGGFSFDPSASSWSISCWSSGWNLYQYDSWFLLGSAAQGTIKPQGKPRNEVSFQTTGATGGTHTLTTTGVSWSNNGGWHHVVFTYDNATKAKKIYFNGVERASGTASHSNNLLWSGNTELSIPSQNDPGNSTLYTKLDTTFVTSDVMEQADVDFAYNSGAGRPIADLAPSGSAATISPLLLQDV